MFLGRSTPQWLALISTVAGATQTLILLLVPALDPVAVGLAIGAIVAILGAILVFLANTATTPVKDPQLVVGTAVRVTDESGTVIGSANVPTPTQP